MPSFLCFPYFQTSNPIIYCSGEWQELRHQVNLVHTVAKTVFAEIGSSLSYKVGTMIEIPRAALVADEVS